MKLLTFFESEHLLQIEDLSPASINSGVKLMPFPACRIRESVALKLFYSPSWILSANIYFPGLVWIMDWVIMTLLSLKSQQIELSCWKFPCGLQSLGKTVLRFVPSSLLMILRAIHTPVAFCMYANSNIFDDVPFSIYTSWNHVILLVLSKSWSVLDGAKYCRQP